MAVDVTTQVRTLADTLPDGVVREVTSEEVERFWRDGWVKLEGLVAPDYAAELLAGAQELTGPEGARHEPRPGIDVDFQLWHDYHYPAREGIEPFAALSYSRAMALNAHRLMDRDVQVRHWADMIGCRPPATEGGRASETVPHQDYPGGQFDRVGNTTFWIALNDLPPERGTMRFWTGSHREGPLGRSFHAGGAGTVLAVYPRLRERYTLSEPMHLRPGDATCHSQLVIHQAPQNTTTEPRYHYATIYFPGDALYTGHRFHGVPESGLPVNEPFDHPNFPIVLP